VKGKEARAFYETRVSNWVFSVMFGELAIMLWLIFIGAKERQPQASAARSWGLAAITEPKEVALLIDPGWAASLP
jgi:hypothetical protein